MTTLLLIVADCQHCDDQQIGLKNDYRLLMKEISQLTSDHQLFTFVITASVVRPNGSIMQAEPTNNETECKCFDYRIDMV